MAGLLDESPLIGEFPGEEPDDFDPPVARAERPRVDPTKLAKELDRLG